MPVDSADDLLAIAGLTKRYPGVLALDRIDLHARQGEIHVLVGENGAGKSTLVRCLAGVERPDAGQIHLGGAPYRPGSAAEALRAGVRVVHQELSVLPTLTVAENLFLERLPHRFGIVDRRRMRRQAQDALDLIGLSIRPNARCDRLGIAQLQLVEIARAVGSGECRLLVLDEPTATLTEREVARLFTLLRDLRDRGVGIIYISHHLSEIFDIGDRVSVLRNGRRISTVAASSVTAPQLVQLMVGRELEAEYPPVTPRRVGEELLKVDNLKLGRTSAPVTLSLRAGEVVGVAGLVGSGRTEVMRAIFGADRPVAGRVEVRGRALRLGQPKAAVHSGVSFLTEDRKDQGLVLDLPIAANVTLANIKRVSRYGLMRKRAETRLASDMMARLRMRATGPRQPVRTLSGGNQQKAVLARWLAADSDVLIVDEPTRGIDVGARYEIHQLLLDLAATGKALLVVSSDLAELVGICDRIVVFSRGRVAGQVERNEFDPERVLQLAYSGYLNGTGAA